MTGLWGVGPGDPNRDLSRCSCGRIDVVMWGWGAVDGGGLDG